MSVHVGQNKSRYYSQLLEANKYSSVQFLRGAIRHPMVSLIKALHHSTSCILQFSVAFPFLRVWIIYVALLLDKQDLLCHGKNKPVLVSFKRSFGGFIMVDCHRSLAIQDKQQIFCAPVKKNQWGPSKYGSPSLACSPPQQHNVKTVLTCTTCVGM